MSCCADTALVCSRSWSDSSEKNELQCKEAQSRKGSVCPENKMRKIKDTMKRAAVCSWNLDLREESGRNRKRELWSKPVREMRERETLHEGHGLALICHAEKNWERNQRAVTAWCNLIATYLYEKGQLKIMTMVQRWEGRDQIISQFDEEEKQGAKKTQWETRDRFKTQELLKNTGERSLKDRSLLPPQLFYYLHKAALNEQKKAQKALKHTGFYLFSSISLCINSESSNKVQHVIQRLK